ncbi:MAG: hypothetical protein MK102_12730 [Fuerstiella sp.]|nr:hypothetical protein [Fuerstiella sp.]
MYVTQSILSLSLSLGQLWGVRVRLHLLMFVVIAAVTWRLGSVPLGLLAGTVLLLSVMLHQLAQVCVAHVTGNKVADVMLWPLGGITSQAHGAGLAVQTQVQMAGPVVNLAIALVCLVQLQYMEIEVELFNVFSGTEMLLSQASGSLAVTVTQMTCFANVLLLCVNLLPVVPFDVGRLLRSFLSERYESVEVNDVMLKLGLVISLLGLMTGFIFDQSAVVALASFVIITHLHEIGLRSTQAGYLRSDFDQDDYDEVSGLGAEMEEFESFSGNSEDADTDELIAQSSMMARRTARKESERQRQEAAECEKEEKQVDAILERIHRDGEESLNSAELQLLRKVSYRYRKQIGSRERNTETGR